MINKIIVEINVKIDIEFDGRIFVAVFDDIFGNRVISMIEGIGWEIEVG